MSTDPEPAGTPVFRSDAIAREYRTADVMVRLYCRKKHGSRGDLCEDCAELLAFAAQRLGKCPFHADKMPCSECPVHCYREPYRTRIREVMRFAGPRLLFRHPILAVEHLLLRRRWQKRAAGSPDKTGRP